MADTDKPTPEPHAFMRKDAWCWCGEPKPTADEECRVCMRIRTIGRETADQAWQFDAGAAAMKKSIIRYIESDFPPEFGVLVKALCQGQPEKFEAERPRPKTHRVVIKELGMVSDDGIEWVKE